MPAKADEAAAHHAVLRVFISSTEKDLREHREMLIDACNDLQLLPVTMEHWPAMNADAVAASLARLDESDVFVGVYAHRYGCVPDGSRVSITEMEYDRAVARGIPRLLFVMHADHRIRVADVEFGPGYGRLAEFKRRIGKRRVWKEFESPVDLKCKFTIAINPYIPRGPESVSDDVQNAEPGPEVELPSAGLPAEPTPAEADVVPGTATPIELTEATADATAVAVDWVLTSSSDGQSWAEHTGDVELPEGSRIRVMVRPSRACSAVLLVESRDEGGLPIGLNVFGASTTEGKCLPGATVLEVSGLWQTIPLRRYLREQYPKDVASWRLGLVLDRQPPAELLALVNRAYRHAGDVAAPPDETVASLVADVGKLLQSLAADRSAAGTETGEVHGFGLDRPIVYSTVAVAGPTVVWREVRFRDRGER